MSDTLEIKEGNVCVVRVSVGFYVDFAVATRDPEEALRVAAAQSIEDLSNYGEDYEVEGSVDGVAYGVLSDDLDRKVVEIAGYGVSSHTPVIHCQERADQYPGLEPQEGKNDD
jgi:hypothetical protein